MQNTGSEPGLFNVLYSCTRYQSKTHLIEPRGYKYVPFTIPSQDARPECAVMINLAPFDENWTPAPWGDTEMRFPFDPMSDVTLAPTAPPTHTPYFETTKGEPSISLDEIASFDVGSEILLNAFVTNTGDETGLYSITCSCSETAGLGRLTPIEAGQQVSFPFTVLKEDAGEECKLSAELSDLDLNHRLAPWENSAVDAFPFAEGTNLLIVVFLSGCTMAGQ